MRNSPERKAYQKAYHASQKEKDARKRRRSTPEYKAKQAEYWYRKKCKLAGVEPAP